MTDLNIAQYIDIVFEGEHGPDGPRFVEVENEHGQSIQTGAWLFDADDNQSRLRIKVKPGLNALGMLIRGVSADHGFEAKWDNVPEKLMLAVSELAEALEEHRKSKEKFDTLVYKIARSTSETPPSMSLVQGEGEPPKVSYEGNEYTLDEAISFGWFKAKPEGLLVEAADAVIRGLDLMQGLIDEARQEGIENVPSIEEVLMGKINYNMGRPAFHGKAY